MVESDDSNSDDSSDMCISIDMIKDPRTIVVQLKNASRRLGLAVRGRKHDLVERLVDFITYTVLSRHLVILYM